MTESNPAHLICFRQMQCSSQLLFLLFRCEPVSIGVDLLVLLHSVFAHTTRASVHIAYNLNGVKLWFIKCGGHGTMSWMSAANKQFISNLRSTIVLIRSFCFHEQIKLRQLHEAWMKESKISLINLREQGKSMTNYTRMFRGKMRMSTCRIILITSLAWLLIDVIIIMRYSDGLSSFKKSSHDNEVDELEFFGWEAARLCNAKQGSKVKAPAW